VNKTELKSPVRSANDLHLFLFDRPLHPELFRHFGDFRVTQTRYHVDIWIIGLSHVVTVSCGNRSMTEVIAPDLEVLPSRGGLAHFRMKGERDLEKAGPEGWHYMVSTQVETMDEPLYKSVHNDLLRHAGKRGWFLPYEQWAEGALAPFSYVDHEARDGEFHVHAFHAFPHEHTIVKTQSIFEIPPAE